ncbi:MAG: S-layer homology domain-containing protein, partial [Clostridia bacterium]|nr:S-layer homology domain-containing protein [Clostridia bacterium]
VCGEILVAQEVIPATGHTEETIPAVPATCTESGLTEGKKCSVCGEILVAQEVIPAAGHTEETIPAVPATCTESGLTEGKKCSVCGEILVAQETVAALGHDWDEGVVTTPATYTEEGVLTFTCKRCGEKRTESIPKKHKFDDVADTDWFAPYVDYAYENGLMLGVSDNLFDPNGVVTRGMIITIIWRLEGSPTEGTAPFKDLKEDWYKSAIAWGYKNGIVKGYSDTQYAPDEPVTREQFCAIFFRYTEFKGESTSARGNLSAFPDADKISDYAKESVSWAIGSGLITGDNRNGVKYIDPNGSTTRAQAATILTRYCTK